MSDLRPDAIGDRGASPVAGPITPRRLGRWASLIGLATALVLIGLASLPSHPPPAPTAPARQVVAFEPATTSAPTLQNPGPNPPKLSAATTAIPNAASRSAPPDLGRTVPSESGDATGPETSPRSAAAAQAAQARAELHAIRAAPMIAFARTPPASAAPAALPVAARAEPVAESGLDRLRQASRLGLARAERLAARDYRLSAGAHIPCVLETALDSTTPGYVTCLAPSDVYSDTGALVVLDKGTRVLGEYRADLRPGQGRLFILWSRAVTPGGVAIQLASPASDALGRAGVSGDLDSHFWDRFGGAVMMSLVDDAGAQIQTELGGQQGLRLPSPTSALALQSGLTVAPTLRKDAGALVSIFVAQDLDFSGVYGLAPRAP